MLLLELMSTEKTIEEIEDEIEQAEKDSVAEDIIDAAEAIQLIR